MNVTTKYPHRKVIRLGDEDVERLDALAEFYNLKGNATIRRCIAELYLIIFSPSSIDRTMHSTETPPQQNAAPGS